MKIPRLVLSLRDVFGRSFIMSHHGGSTLEEAKTSWPFRNMACALAVSIVLSAFVLPTPQGLEIFRDLLYFGFVVVFLARWRMAVVHREQNRAWFFYLALIIAAPLIVLLCEPVLKEL